MLEQTLVKSLGWPEGRLLVLAHEAGTRLAEMGLSGEAILVLARTGSRVRVDMAEWEQWLEAPETSEGERLHPLVVGELREAVPAIKAAIPTSAAAMEALDGESKGWTRGKD